MATWNVHEIPNKLESLPQVCRRWNRWVRCWLHHSSKWWWSGRACHLSCSSWTQCSSNCCSRNWSVGGCGSPPAVPPGCGSPAASAPCNLRMPLSILEPWRLPAAWRISPWLIRCLLRPLPPANFSTGLDFFTSSRTKLGEWETLCITKPPCLSLRSKLIEGGHDANLRV